MQVQEWLEFLLWLGQSASAIGALASEQSQESTAASLSVGIFIWFILSLFPSIGYLLMKHNIQKPCFLVKWIPTMELRYKVFLVEKAD